MPDQQPRAGLVFVVELVAAFGGLECALAALAASSVPPLPVVHGWAVTVPLAVGVLVDEWAEFGRPCGPVFAVLPAPLFALCAKAEPAPAEIKAAVIIATATCFRCILKFLVGLVYNTLPTLKGARSCTTGAKCFPSPCNAGRAKRLCPGSDHGTPSEF